MMVQTGLDYIKNPDKIINLTTTPRPPVFTQEGEWSVYNTLQL